MDFLPVKIKQYVEANSSTEDPLLKEITRDTHLHVLNPRMLSGHFQGRILSMLSKMISPNRILEIGTYTGYSALCLAEGLMEDGKLYTIDINEELEDRLRQYFLESNYNQQIDFVIGDALHLIPRLNESWDVVFIDADKKNYTKYFNMVVASVKSGGYIIADNVLWSGKVVEKDHVDEDTLALRVFNDTLSKDPRFEVILLPVRDGLLIARKK